VAYVTDHEPFWDPADRSFSHPGDQHRIDFLRGADLIIHDAQYTPEEDCHRVGWGHGTIDYATDVAVAAGAARLALFHHDPSHDDAWLARLEAVARGRVAAQGGRPAVFAAAEGLALEIQGTGGTAAMAKASALRRRSVVGKRVMLVSADAAQTAAMARALAEDALQRIPVRH
jgi:hypothetical protein